MVRNAGACLTLKARRGVPAVDNAEHTAHDLGAAGEQETQQIGDARHPLAHRRLGKDLVDQQRGTRRHTPLIRETGFYPGDRILLRQLQHRLWRNARGARDVRIHTGRLTFEEAISLLSAGVGFLRWAAQLEVDGSAQGPSTASATSSA